MWDWLTSEVCLWDRAEPAETKTTWDRAEPVEFSWLSSRSRMGRSPHQRARQSMGIHTEPAPTPHLRWSSLEDLPWAGVPLTSRDSEEHLISDIPFVILEGVISLLEKKQADCSASISIFLLLCSSRPCSACSVWLIAPLTVYPLPTSAWIWFSHFPEQRQPESIEACWPVIYIFCSLLVYSIKTVNLCFWVLSHWPDTNSGVS